MKKIFKCRTTLPFWMCRIICTPYAYLTFHRTNIVQKEDTKKNWIAVPFFSSISRHINEWENLANLHWSAYCLTSVIFVQQIPAPANCRANTICVVMHHNRFSRWCLLLSNTQYVDFVQYRRTLLSLKHKRASWQNVWKYRVQILRLIKEKKIYLMASDKEKSSLRPIVHFFCK